MAPSREAIIRVGDLPPLSLIAKGASLRPRQAIASAHLNIWQEACHGDLYSFLRIAKKPLKLEGRAFGRSMIPGRRILMAILLYHKNRSLSIGISIQNVRKCASVPACVWTTSWICDHYCTKRSRREMEW